MSLGDNGLHGGLCVSFTHRRNLLFLLLRSTCVFRKVGVISEQVDCTVAQGREAIRTEGQQQYKCPRQVVSKATTT